MVERIKQIIEYYGLNTRQFEEKIYASNGQIYTLLSRGGSLNYATLVKILENCNEISSDWLLLGKGEMLRQNVSKSDVLSADHEAVYKNFIADKEKKIEELTRENEQLRIENKQLKSSSGNTGIVVQHDGGGNNYSINADMQHLVASQQKTILELTEQNLKLTGIIANKL